MASSVVAKNFANLGFNTSTEWFGACLEWCKQNDPAISGDKIVKAIREQWLITDIRDDGVQAKQQLKAEWTRETTKKVVIKDSLVLQILSAIDIGQSAYGQLQTLLKVKNENTRVTADNDNESQLTASGGTQYRQAAWEPKPTRMLKLSLTDGFKTIHAVEHETIPDLGAVGSISPGCKIKIRGPVTCRRGSIMLTRSSVQVLGGEVEEMKLEFDAKKILSTVIGTENVGQQDPNIPTVNINSGRDTRPLSRGDQQNNMNLNNANANVEPMDDMDDEIFNELEIPPIPSTSSRKVPSDNDLKEDQPRAKIERRDTSFSSKPFQYLKTCSRQSGSEVTIKACVTTFCSKLTTKKVDGKTCWSFSIAVTDGSDSLTAEIDESLLASMIGKTPAEIGAMSKQNRASVTKILDDFKEKLFTFNGLIKVKFVQDPGRPVITAMTPMNRGHLQQLKKRQ